MSIAPAIESRDCTHMAFFGILAAVRSSPPPAHAELRKDDADDIVERA